MEAVSREVAHWLVSQHRVMQAVLDNALDPNRKDQKEWCDYYFQKVRELPRSRTLKPAATPEDEVEIDFSES